MFGPDHFGDKKTEELMLGEVMIGESSVNDAAWTNSTNRIPASAIEKYSKICLKDNVCWVSFE